MDIEQRLTDLADRYRSQGYQVVLRPQADDLPDFAKEFKVEIVARRPDGSALVSAKKSPKDLEADPNVASYAEISEKHPGWRFDVVALGPDDETKIPNRHDAREPSEDDLRFQFEIIGMMLDAHGNQQALVNAWSILEAAMRRRLQAEGEEAGWGSSPRTMLNQLLSLGALSHGEFRDLEGLFPARNAIVHGFTIPAIEPSAVHFLLDIARKLREEANIAKQPA